MKRIAIQFARLGPYHVARLESAAEVLGAMGWRVVALETAGKDSTYLWEKTNAKHQTFERWTVFEDQVFEEISSFALKRGIFRALDELHPEVVVVAGWGTVDARACLAWCKCHGAKAIVMSETRSADGRRVWWKEWLKSRIVRQFDGALCGGESHKQYLIDLGMTADRIVFGYNVIDNQFFYKNSKRERGNEGQFSDLSFQFIDPEAQLLREPEIPSSTRYASKPSTSHATSQSQPSTGAQALVGPYFLASNRFVERKNLARLIRAYASYVKNFQFSGGSFQNREGRCIWPLVLLGDGELREELVALCAELGLRTKRGFSQGGTEHTEGEDLKLNSYKLKTPAEGGLVVFTGFRQIEELPAFYGSAGAFIHPALSEPWGLVVNEAMASGLPVISSRNVGAAEELVENGKTGFLFDPTNIEELAGLMIRIAGMPLADREIMGMAGRQFLERKVPKRAFGEGLAQLIGVHEKRL